jgi:3-methyladenine DNA glycosylase AlkC
LTQRFTAEFSIRRFLERYPTATLARLGEWARDASPHVRRLVSEGTRPRLPWAPRLRDFQRDPRPVLALLELFKDDPVLYVRRSVANNLNDIGKDHPALLVETARRWMKDAPDARRWLIRHALRSAVKRADSGALEIMGFCGEAKVAISKASIAPKHPRMGDSVTIAFEITNTDSKRQRVLVDLCVHFVKANGKTRPKVFKLKALEFGPGETAQLRKVIALTEMTTRKHYAGTHCIYAMLNGRAEPLGDFALASS